MTNPEYHWLKIPEKEFKKIEDVKRNEIEHNRRKKHKLKRNAKKA